MSDEDEDDGSSRFSQLIELLFWVVELGRIGMYPEVGLLSSQVALLRVEYLEAAYCTNAYLNTQNKSRRCNKI